MAPGPMGQCHPLPNDVAILSEMNKVAHNYQTLHNMYNFDWDPEPGSVQHMIDQRIIRVSHHHKYAESEWVLSAFQYREPGTCLHRHVVMHHV